MAILSPHNLEEIAGNLINWDVVYNANLAKINEGLTTYGAGVAGETLVENEWVYFKESDQKLYKAKADSLTTMPPVGVITTGGVLDETVRYRKSGEKTGMTGLTVGKMYISSTTAGALAITPGDVPFLAGLATSTTAMLVDLKTWWFDASSGDEVLFPDFPGALNYLDGGDNTGTWSLDTELVGNIQHNHYKFASSEASLQHQNIMLKWRLPPSFRTWKTGDCIVIDIATHSTASADNHVDLTITKDGVGTTEDVLNKVSAVADQWQCDQDSNAVLTLDAASSTVLQATETPGDILALDIRIEAKDSNWGKVGAVSFKWLK